MITNPNDYFTSGCGRCSKFDTPECKIHKWLPELLKLRALVLDCGLTEVAKWGHPVYLSEGRNILMINAFLDNALISFFKGSLLQDEHKLLTLPGENAETGRVIRFTKVGEIEAVESILKQYIYEAIEIEKAGLKPQTKKIEEYTLPEELTQKFNEMPALKAAFEALTPGRQKGYLFHFAGAKQSQTRMSRIEKCIPQIMIGKGFYD